MVEVVETLSVSLSGPAFSLLIYDNVRSKYDQEGFLLGEIIEKKTNSITDHDRQITKIDRIMRISSAIPCPRLSYFYDAAGRLNENQITTCLENQNGSRLKVVGWYKFKHTNGFKMTLREKIVHKNLAQYLASTSPDLFTCCLLTMDSSPDGATHTYAQTFLRYVDNGYQMIPMHIMNLSDPNNFYKSTEPASDTFSELIKSLEIDRKEAQGTVIVTKVNEELLKQTEQKVKELAEKEKMCCELEDEVRLLMEQVKNKLISRDTNITESLKISSGSGDSACSMDSTNIAENISGTIASDRGRKKTLQLSNTRNSSSSPIGSRTRRSANTKQKNND